MVIYHKNLDVYRLAIEFVKIAGEIAVKIPRGQGQLADQLRRSSSSVALNTGEGIGEFASKEKARFYRMALRSATESAINIDIVLAFGYIDDAAHKRAEEVLERSLSYTWARKGSQPEVKTSGKRRGYKVFGAIDYFTGRFFFQAQEERLESASYIAYLDSILQKTKKHVILIQDGAKYHVSQDLMVYFYKNRHRLTVFQLPTYSPDYNPSEMLWRNIKRKGVHLKYFPSFQDLKNTVNGLLLDFKEAAKEVLGLFGLYNKLTPSTS